MEIREMTKQDYQQVMWIDQMAFSAHYRKTYGINKLMERIPEGLSAYQQRTGTEGIVLEYHGQVVGYAFSHQWGSLGWFGPIGIDLNYQGRGFGKQLILHIIEQLSELDVREIGLETMVNSPNNIGMYMSLGLKPLHPVFDMVRTVKGLKGAELAGASAIRPNVTFVHYLPDEVLTDGDTGLLIRNAQSDDGTGKQNGVCPMDGAQDSEFTRLKEIARGLTDAVIPGLDYEPELELMLQYGFGRVILMQEEGEPVGLALLMTTDLRGQQGFMVTIRGLVIKPATPENEYLRLSELLRQIYQVTRELNCTKVALTAYSGNDSLVRYLMKEERFTVNFPYLRMVKNDPQFPMPVGGIELSRWRG